MFETFGFRTTTTTSHGKFKKCYHNITPYHWNRILSASMAFSSAEIGPQVLAIDETRHCIEYEEIIPFNHGDETQRPNLFISQIIKKINVLVRTMHELGYGHGDLHINNLGFKGEHIYILDHDTVYNISEGEVPWLKAWMENGFEWDGTFEEFVQLDYENWKTDWLDI